MTVVGVHSWSGGPISTLLRKANIEQAVQAQSIPVVADRGNTRQLGIYGICRASAVASHSDPTTRNRLRA